jgi:sarcosine oxidase
LGRDHGSRNRNRVKTNYDYIVLGLGGIGAGAAYWLARRAGSEVLGLEQFEIGHVRGESQDHSRIIRLSYHTRGYVALAKRTYATWAEVEADLGEKLIVKTGGLDLAPANTGIPLDPYVASMAAEGVPFETLDAREVMRRWPAWHLSDDVTALFQAESGIAPAARCNAAHLKLARQHGATLRDQAPVSALRGLGGEVEVVAGGTTYRCRRLIIAAGPWCNGALAHFGLKLPLTVTQEQVTYFAPADLDLFQPGRFPIWIWLDVPCFYGFPVYGEPGPKVAQDVGGDEVTAETRTFEPNPATLERTLVFLRRYLPGMPAGILYTKTCLYTLPPDRDFVLDALPGHPNIFMAVGAAHAFKFASLLGKTLAELAVDGTTGTDLAPFRFDRPILQMQNPPKNFMT